MASWQAHLLRLFVKLRVGPQLRDMSQLARVRKVFDSPLPPPRGARFVPAELGGVPGEWVEADFDERPDRPWLFYIHGGGFVGCSPRTHRAVTASFARLGWRVFVPDYRLAPEHRFPAALDDVRAAWLALCDAHAAAAPDTRLAMAGDSAGGNLALAAMVCLRDAGQRLPDAVALFSPSTDMTGDSPSLITNTGRDPMFRGAQLVHLAQAYLGPTGDPAHPLVSPVRADLSGLPPLLIHVGEDEVLRDDGLRLAQKARAAGVRVESLLWAVVPHGWQLVPRLPEARRSLAAAAYFLRSAAPHGVRLAEPAVPGADAGSSHVGAGVPPCGTAVTVPGSTPLELADTGSQPDGNDAATP